jgi:hypothetical protein
MPRPALRRRHPGHTTGPRAWKRSLIELTNTVRELAQRRGNSRASSWIAIPKPGPLVRGVPNIEIRLHRTTLYNSIYRADDQLLVNQHAYGVHASHAPVFCLNGAEHGDMAAAYVASFKRVWLAAMPIVTRHSP